MPVKKISVALDADVAEAAAASAAEREESLSAWLNAAARERLAIEAGLAAVKDWESEHGELTGDELAAAREILDRLGDGRDLGA
jgi:hypothetical protein